LTLILVGVSAVALCRLLLPDIGAETVPGPALLWIDRLWGWWTALALAAVALGIGRLLTDLPLLSDCRDQGLLGALLQISLGLWALTTGLAALSLARALNGVFLAVLVATAVAAGGAGLIRLSRDVAIGHGHNTGDGGFPGSKSWRAVALLGSWWMVSLLVQSLLPNSEWDGASAHLPLAHRLVTEGLWATDPVYVHFDLPGGANLLYALLLQLRAESALIPMNLLVSIGTALTALSLALRLWGSSAGKWALAVAVATNLLWELGLDLRVDGFLAFACGVAAAAFAAWLYERDRPGLLVAAGAAMGLAVGIKYNGLILLMSLSIAVVGIILSEARWRLKGTIAAAMLATVVVVIPSGAWYLRNTIELGAPFYPKYSDLLFTDASGRLFEFTPAFGSLRNRVMTPAEQAALSKRVILGVDLATPVVRDPNRKLFNLWDLLWHPSLYTRNPLHWLSPFLFAGLLLPLVYRNRASLWFFGVTLAACTVAASMTYLVRYALFVVPLVAAAAGAVLAQVRWRGAIVAVGFLIGAQIVTNGAAEWFKLAGMGTGSFLTGRVSRLEWLAEVGYSGNPGMVRLTHHINSMVESGTLGRDETVFMVGESKGLDLECRYLPDLGNECLPWMVEMILANGDLDRIAHSFRNRGIRFVVLNSGFLNWCLRESITNSERVGVAMHLLDRFLGRYARRIRTDAGVDLYEILPEAETTFKSDFTRRR
jgi:hypothetical protein